MTTVPRPRRMGKKSFTETYRTVHQVPLHNSDDALMVNGGELVTTEAHGGVLYRNAWATSPQMTADNVAALAAAGRTRWKIDSSCCAVRNSLPSRRIFFFQFAI